MGDTIIVTAESSPASPTTPASPATPPETEHSEAVQFGVMIAQQSEILEKLALLSERVITLEGAQEASRAALSAVVDTVEDVAGVVEEIATDEPTEDDEMPVPPPAPADDEPEDTPPGKTHWFRRSGREWAGK